MCYLRTFVTYLQSERMVFDVEWNDSLLRILYVMEWKETLGSLADGPPLKFPLSVRSA